MSTVLDMLARSAERYNYNKPKTEHLPLYYLPLISQTLLAPPRAEQLKLAYILYASEQVQAGIYNVRRHI